MKTHEHLIIRSDVRLPPKDPEYIVDWLRKLVDDIGMKILVGPQAVYSEMIGNRGLTAFAIIETSHVVLHSWDECSPGMLQLDVYSCAPVDREIVLAAIDEFNPITVDFKFLDRSDNFIRIA